MDPVLLSRIQFAVTIGFHYIFPPISIGLGLIIVIMEGIFIKTKNPLYYKMTRFWVKIFALVFAIGVATGIVMEFQFGTNWATYSRYVGDVFGSPLAAEGIFAFFLESGFLAILVFGWNRVSARTHFISAMMVCLGAHFSAVWIVVANSWMQTPAGYHMVGEGVAARAEITDFWAMVLNPSTVERLTHTVIGAWQAGAFFVLSVSAYYILRKKHIDFAKASLRIALFVALFASVMQLVTGHDSAMGIARHQPAKLAAFEGHYENEPGKLWLFGWVNEKDEKVRFGIGIPGMLSYMVYGDTETPMTGLSSFAPEDRPPVNVVFQSYHLMVAIGMGLIALSVIGVFLLWRKKLFDQRWLMGIFVLSVLGPQMANQLGWISAEVGRQPWIVYGLLRTENAVSKVVTANQVLGSLLMFTVIYIFLFTLFIYLLDHKIKKGPGEKDEPPAHHLA